MSSDKHGITCPTPEVTPGETTTDWLAVCPHYELAGQGETPEKAQASLVSVLTNHISHISATAKSPSDPILSVQAHLDVDDDTVVIRTGSHRATIWRNSSTAINELARKIEHESESRRGNSVCPVERVRIRAFEDAHMAKHGSEVEVRYQFIGTGIGTVIKLVCGACKETCDATDYEHF